DVVAIVDGVEIAGCPGVPHERVARDRETVLRDDLADLERHQSSPRTTSVDVAVTTCAPSASTISDSAVTIEWPPIDFTLVTVMVAVSSSPATMGREYANR